MKNFIKVFLISLIIFSLISGYYVYDYYSITKSELDNYKPPIDPNWNDPTKFIDKDANYPSNDLINAINNSKRVNFLMIGLEWPRTDTIMLVSFDQASRDLDIISIPRDSYYYKEGFRSGFDDPGEYKINAIYGDEGPEGLILAVEDILNIPIHHYVTLTYSGVENIVDSIGGVEVDIPYDMYYKDEYDDPPLLIDIKAGHQVLNGKKSIEFLRFRQNSDGSVKYGDLQRIKAQQQFIKSALNKTLSFRLPLVIKEVFNTVKTDADIFEVLEYANTAIGINMDNINMSTAPGNDEYIDGTSFYLLNEDELDTIIEGLYNVDSIEDVDNASL